jgi:hypothetical protein
MRILSEGHRPSAHRAAEPQENSTAREFNRKRIQPQENSTAREFNRKRIQPQENSTAREPKRLVVKIFVMNARREKT